MSYYKIGIVFVFTVAITSIALIIINKSNSQVTIKETFIVNESKIKNGSNYFVSPDYKHFAYIRKIKHETKSSKSFKKKYYYRYQLVVDKKPQDPCTLITDVSYSKDSKRITYICRYANTSFNVEKVIVNNVLGPTYDYIDELKFNANGQHFAYSALRDAKSFLVIDHKEMMELDGRITNFIFSRDGAAIIALIEKSKKYFIAYTHKNGTKFKSEANGYLTDINISARSKHFIYKVFKDKKECIVINGKQYQCYDDISDIQIGKIKQRFSYTAKKGKKSYLIVHNLDTGQIKVHPNNFYYHPDSNRYIETKLENNKVVIVDKNKYNKPIDYISKSNFKFSDNGKSYALIASRDSEEFIVFNSKEDKPYREISNYDNNMHFSPDGKRFMYTGIKSYINGYRTVIVDGKEYFSYRFATDMKFTKDSKVFAYLGHFYEVGKGNHQVVLDGKKGKLQDTILEQKDVPDRYFHIEPDSKTVRYYIKKDKNKNIYYITETF